jgi:hypothetical protein
MIYHLLESQSLAAHGAPVGRKIGIAFNPGNTSIFNMDEYSATTVTTPAIAFYYLFFTHFTHTVILLSLTWDDSIPGIRLKNILMD